MRTYLALLLTMITLATRLFGQGTFALQNFNPNAPVFDAGGQPLEGANYAAELYGGPTSLTLTPTLVLSTLTRRTASFLTGASAGYFADGASHTVFDIPLGGSAWLQVKAWDTRLGANYEAVEALGIGGYGESNLFYADGGDPTILELPGFLIGLESFSLRPVVPEPSALALVAVGIFCFGLRIRKQNSWQ